MSWQEAKEISYEEMLILVDQASFEEQSKDLVAFERAVSLMPMADPDAVKKETAQIKRQLRDLEIWYYGSVEAD